MSPFTLAYLARLEAWALLAVLLQGALVWLSWAAWEGATPASAARLRHRLACLHLAALVLLPALTLAVLQWSVEGMVYTVRCDRACAAGEPGYGPLLALAAPAALIWASGAAIMAARLALGAWALRRLPTRPASAATVEAVGRLASRWGGRLSLQVREAEVDAPQVIGLRRPMLLLPPRFCDRLGPDEREAVLLHELAHAARGDFGWNLVQRLILAALWFHPTAWRLYRRLRQEREARCDALAVRRGASPAGLARALVRLAEDRSRGRLGMALSNRSDLAVRLRRLVDAGAQRPPARVAGGLALLASALCVLTLGAGRLVRADPSIRDAYVASAFGPTLSLEAHDRAGSFTVEVRQGRVVAASVGRRPAQVVQRGGEVLLIGAPDRPVVALTVSPQGGIRWAARS
jgi:beta-lactamase regulating signal transducer with metallopeptidase domain